MDLNFIVYRSLPTAYDEPSAVEETEMQDHPYHVYRLSHLGKVNRACFRYLGDATQFVKAVIPGECSHCQWIIRNEESGRLCARWEYRGGKIERQV